MGNAALEHQLWLLLGVGVLPLWLLAGLCDYITHARTRIAETSGVPESFLHLLQTAEIGVPLLAVLLLEVNALVLVLAVAGVVAHSLTAYVDVRYALPRRHVSAFEQFVHAFLIVLPFTALALVVILHWTQFASLWRGDASWVLEWKRHPWDARMIASVLAGSLLFGVLPGVYEFMRTWRARARTNAAS
ncbi:hypothetical protein [Lysobacter sp. Root494]|uniref:hypothetical protein n=1 Tax=Lysobacter sp. Root494 TaxID=1736549 RepID=UPI0006FBDECC|nr:hypothetical protein [Lysobacter sp. Root494]KQY52320.1 hypothetical protein ASD14_06710 [Lysobacter sp. Root494]